MALHNVGQAKDEITALLQGVVLDTVENVDGALERAARTVVTQADIPEASGVQPITLYNGVYYYPAPTTMFGGAINLIRRQGDASSPLDYNYKTTIDEFTRGKQFLPNGYMLDIEYQNGVALFGISTPNTFPRVVLSPMSDASDWTAGGSASGLATDTTNYYQQPASVRFTLTGASTGNVSTTLNNPVNMSSYEGVGVMFLAVNIPDVDTLTNIAVSIGSDSSNYATVTETEGFLGAWTSGSWLLVALDLSTAVNTGAPDFSAIDYVDVAATTTGTQTNFRIGGLWSSLPAPHEILFETSAIFLDNNGVPTQSITSDGNTITLNDASYNLFIYESALTIALQQGGSLSSNLVQTYRAILYGNGNTDLGLYARYRADNPSEELRTISSYYDVGQRGGYGRGNW